MFQKENKSKYQADENLISGGFVTNYDLNKDELSGSKYLKRLILSELGQIV